MITHSLIVCFSDSQTLTQAVFLNSNTANPVNHPITEGLITNSGDNTHNSMLLTQARQSDAGATEAASGFMF